MVTKSTAEKALETIKDIEKQYADRCKGESKDPNDFLQMSYYSGLLNGYNFAFYLIEHSPTEEQMKVVLNDILHLQRPS